jgi:membrane-bound lytic murein transglycosylase F
MADLAGLKIMVIAGSSYEEALVQASESIQDLEWESRSDVGIEALLLAVSDGAIDITLADSNGIEALLLAVSDGAIDITLADSNIYHLNGHYYPRVAAAFTLPGTLPLAWAFAPGPDHSLVREANAFMQQAGHDQRLQAIHNAFYLPEKRLDRVGMFQFLSQVRQRLPELLPVFQQVAATYQMDWRLLAAMGYQESHWKPDASSYTGVRGVMMLTRRTANQLGVTDRLDPEQSIDGGARYFIGLRERIPERIGEPDRSWMALAAYNMGMGHLEDVRVLTQKQGANADAWMLMPGTTCTSASSY